MANNFSATISSPLDTLSLENISVGLSPPVLASVVAQDVPLSPPVWAEVVSVPIDVLSCPFVDAVAFISVPFITFTTYIGDLLTMPDIIQIADASSINVSTLVLTDKFGTGDCVVTPPSGAAYQLLGARLGFENLTGNYSIPQHKSGYAWTNTNASALAATLPSGARIGTSALFIRTGGAVSINPNPNGKIWHAVSGYFMPVGQSIRLESSGAKIGLICDGNNGWYRTIEEGTVV